MEIARNIDIAPILAKKSVFLLGPRQCGKSWLVGHTLENVHVIDLLSSEMFLRLSQHPEQLEQFGADGRPIVINEIQKLPLLLDEVHRLIEKKGYRFLLTGSSVRKLRKKGVNLLGGRARVKRLHPFSAFELKDKFSLDRAINFGLLPSVWFSEEPDEDLSDCIDEYLRQEIISEGATRNLSAFSRFLEVAALSNGEQIDYTAISHDAQVPRSTVQEYFRILQETFWADEVSVWKRGVKRKTVETSKYYLFDTGVIRRLTRRKEVVEGTPEFRHLFETLVHHELKSYLDTHLMDGVINYWRTPSGTEVDFVVGDVAIEAKSAKLVDKRDLNGLQAISEEAVFAHRVVVSREPTARMQDGIEILPYDDFIQRLWGDELVDTSTIALA